VRADRSGVPLQLLPKEINGVRIIGIDVPGFGVPTHAEAKDVLAGAMLKYARTEAEQGPVQAPRGGAQRQADRHAAGRDVSGRSGRHRHDAGAAGLAAGSGGADARMARALRRSIARRSPRSIRSTPPRCASSRPPAAPIVGSAPVGHDGTAAWLDAIGDACGVARDRIDAAKNRFLPAIRGALAPTPIKGRITLSGYEGSELLVARLLIESGADVPYVGTACPRTPWSDPDREWLEARACACSTAPRSSRTSPRSRSSSPISRSARRRSCSTPSRAAIPALYFTNLISARPLMGPAGAGSLAQVVNAALGNKARFDEMSAFFDGVGEGHAAGVWEDTPKDDPRVPERYAKQMAKPRPSAKPRR
jgi:chlorophyllide a reductase subunit Y